MQISWRWWATAAGRGVLELELEIIGGVARWMWIESESEKGMGQ